MLILAALRAGPAHGYALIARLAATSGRHFELPEGTVYPALHKLERVEMIASTWDDRSGKRRRIYRLTRKGRLQLTSQIDVWQRLSSVMFRLLNNPVLEA